MTKAEWLGELLNDLRNAPKEGYEHSTETASAFTLNVLSGMGDVQSALRVLILIEEEWERHVNILPLAKD